MSQQDLDQRNLRNEMTAAAAQVITKTEKVDHSSSYPTNHLI